MVSLLAATTTGQRYQSEDQAGNYLNGDVYSDYEPAEPRPAHPTPRSYNSAPAASQRQEPAAPKPTPIAILKQINRHNEDGSYTYGFEGADGSFKIETKQANGEVKGKYGFVDDGGKVHVVEYGANQYGFQPSGEGITVAPPTLVDETTSKEAIEAQKFQEYQEYQQQQQARSAPAARPAPPARQQAYQPQYQPQYATQQHTQAIYPSQQPQQPKQPIFTPAEQPRPVPPHLSAPGFQSAIQSIPGQLYDDRATAPQPNYKNGPVQFSPTPSQEAHQPRPQPQARSGGGGILDQLARDYALPQGSAAPLHDISFGYY